MIPKYEQIKQDLLEEIKNHHFLPGDKFYSEDVYKRQPMIIPEIIPAMAGCVNVFEISESLIAIKA